MKQETFGEINLLLVSGNFFAPNIRNNMADQKEIPVTRGTRGEASYNRVHIHVLSVWVSGRL